MNLAPIILFCYNRPEHTKKTIEALERNMLASQSDLYIFIDGPKKDEDISLINEIYQYIKGVQGFNKCFVYKSDKNKGLANSVIDGVTKIINKYEKVIVLEDDIITSSKFLSFMNEALEFYENKEKVYSISGYNLPIEIPAYYKETLYLSYRAMSWGWATWKDRWDNIDWGIKDYDKFISNRRKVDDFKQGGDDLPQMLKNQLEGKIDSWAIRWGYNQYKNHQYTIIPVKSLVNNIGFDNSGVHCNNTNRYMTKINEDNDWTFSDNLEINEDIINKFREFYSPKLAEEMLEVQIRRFNFMNKWVDSLINKECLSDKILNFYNTKNVSIYGCGTIGIQLCKQLINENLLNLKYFVDKNINDTYGNIECITVDKYLESHEQDDLLIISPFYYYEEIKNEFCSKGNLVNIISIEELLY